MYKFDKTKLAFIGDSVTEGCFGFYETSYGFDTYREPEKSYPRKVTAALKNAFGETAVEPIYAGVSGDSTAKILLRIDDVLALKPDIAVVASGLNDIFRPFDKIRENYSLLISKIAQEVPAVIVMTPPMIAPYVRDDIPQYARKFAVSAVEKQNDGTLRRIAQIEREVAAKYGAKICDVYSYWENLYLHGEDVTLLMANMINHPCEKMHDEAARLLLETLEKI